MTDSEQRRLVQICGMLGYIEDNSCFKDIFIDTERQQIVANLESIIKKLKLQKKDVDHVYNKIKHGVLRIEVVNDHEINTLIKRYTKTNVGLEFGAMCTLMEHAMQSCVDCKSLRSKCELRRALLKANAPVANDGFKKCQFNHRQGD